jgi:hypothetical protein
MSGMGQAMPSGGIGGILPTQTNATANPLMQQNVQQYQQMTPEQLQQLAMRLGNSPQGAIVQKVLQQKRMMPTSAPNANPTAQLPMQQAAPQLSGQPMIPGQQQPQMKRGGMVPLKRAMGGMSLGEMDPSWTRTEGRDAVSDTPHFGGARGFLAGDTSGRADAIKTTAPSGAYVWPADVVSGIGEGNSLAGAKIIQAAMATGPWGTPVPRGGRGMGIPRAPRVAMPNAKGGGVQGHVPGKQIPVMLSHGEVVSTPEEVAAKGGGNLKHGWKILDETVKEVRKRNIAKLKKLPGPAK